MTARMTTHIAAALAAAVFIAAVPTIGSAQQQIVKPEPAKSGPGRGGKTRETCSAQRVSAQG